MVWKPDTPAHIKALYICLNVVKKQSRSSSHSQRSQLNAAEPLLSSQWLLVLSGLSWWCSGLHCRISREHFFTLLWTCHALSVNSFCWPSLPRPLKGCLGSTETFYNTSFLSSIWLCISFFASVEQLTWSGTSFPVASQTQLWPLHPV